VARWLRGQGFQRLSILEGGLSGWRESGFTVDTLQDEVQAVQRQKSESAAMPTGPASFLPSLADRYLLDGGLPKRRRLTTLFVDIAGSTRLLAHHPPEVVLGVVQRFMRLVTDVALAYCGDVMDYEGDGALLYFESTDEATRAALAIRAALGQGISGVEGPVTARMSLTVGDVVLGVIGTELRQAIALIGPSVSVGARLLKQIPPGGIIATGEVVEALREDGSKRYENFRLLDPSYEVLNSGGIIVSTYTAA
jgi:class 3 adenylate cyclase